MAPSSSVESLYLNSTSGLLSLLDLNLQQDQNMEEMDIDDVVDVPDTPDRLAAHHIIGKECVGRESNSSFAASSRNPDFMDGKCINGLRRRGRHVNDNGQNRRLVFHSHKNLSNEEPKGSNNSLLLSPSENPNTSQNAHLFRRPAKGKSFISKPRHSVVTERMDKGKGKCIRFASRSSGCDEDRAFLDLTEPNGYAQKPSTVFPCDAMKDLLVEDKRKEQILNVNGSSNCILDSSMASSNAYKGKEKLEDSAFKGPQLTLGHGTADNLCTHSQQKTEKQMFKPAQSLALPRVSGQKRLVRNGCISPHNIATRAKQLAEGQSTSCIAKQSPLGDVVSKSTPCLINIKDIVSEDSSGDRVKGKGVVAHPFTSKEQDDTSIHATGRSVINETDGSSYAIRNAFGCSEGLGGWRSTRSRSRNSDHPFSDFALSFAGRIDANRSVISQQNKNLLEQRDARSGLNDRAEHDFANESNAAQATSKVDSEVDWLGGPHHASNTTTRRQKKHRLTSRNAGECSTSVSDESDVVFLGSSGQNSRSSRPQTRGNRGGLGPVIEVDDSSPEMRRTVSHGLGCVNNDDSVARARQVEADEMLARELQEQLYHEEPVVGGGGTDENLAWGMPQEDILHAGSGGRNSESHPWTSWVSGSHRQTRSRPSQNAPTRRGSHTSSRLAQLMRTQTRVPTSSRITQLRNRFSRHSSTASPNGRNVQFPMDMDLDMRLDILEALEAAVGDLSDMSMVNSAFQVQRDFNENDYEMLLALDDNNHQHAGASANQINCLPQSTVQTNTSEEACAICLENPDLGETIRHLPCLHKFHKDCIDPWLSRKASCPVCKSSIT